eukprot:jgi/Chrzof1/9413/Cz04g02050.t1_PPD9[v5.2]
MELRSSAVSPAQPRPFSSGVAHVTRGTCCSVPKPCIRGASLHAAPADARPWSTEHICSRRDVFNYLPAMPMMLGLLTQVPAMAAEDTTASSTTVQPAVASASQPESDSWLPFTDNDWQLQLPTSYQYKETPMPQRERGPAPERSPLRARFDSPDGSEVVSIIVQKATIYKQTLFQVTDISQLGDPIATAKLLLPRGSTLLYATQDTQQLPARQTPVGSVELPPRTYYRYEFTTGTGLHVAMAAAAQRGQVYVCGAAVGADRWKDAKQRLKPVVQSFMLRSNVA